MFNKKDEGFKFRDDDESTDHVIYHMRQVDTEHKKWFEFMVYVTAAGALMWLYSINLS